MQAARRSGIGVLGEGLLLLPCSHASLWGRVQASTRGWSPWSHGRKGFLIAILKRVPSEARVYLLRRVGGRESSSRSTLTDLRSLPELVLTGLRCPVSES